MTVSSPCRSSRTRRFGSLLLAGLTALTLGACSGSSSQSDSSATVPLLLADAPVDDLSSFELTVIGAFLVTSEGEGDNLLAAARTFDILALGRRPSLVQLLDLRGLTIEGLRITIDPGSVLARDRSGAPVDVMVESSVALAMLPQPLTAPQASHGLRADLRLDRSLDRDESGLLRFRPVLELEARGPSSEGIDEIHGEILALERGRRALTVRLREPDSDASLGDLVVRLSADVSLLDDRGIAFASEGEFFDAARPGLRLEADGTLESDGAFLATTLRLDDDQYAASIRGVITQVDVATQVLSLRMTSVERGRALVLPVLEELGNPATIQVSYADAFLSSDESRGAVTTDDLIAGREIKAKFAEFSLPAPFAARSIELEDGAEFEGTIVDTGGLPGAFTFHLEPHDPAVVSGRVQSSTTDVTVMLSGEELVFLKVEQEPSLEIRLLSPGLRVRVRGALSGPASAPSLDATQVRVRPGRLDGTVIGVDRATSSFEIEVDDVDDPFGGDAGPGPVRAVFLADSVVEDDARDPQDFFDRFDGLREGERLEVRLEGLRDPSGGQVLAYRLEVEVRD